jgi:putative ABC transport system ATP-binding protein
MRGTAMISFEKVSKEYLVGDQKVEALKEASFSIEEGQMTVILGPSGSGKSTALNLLGGMDRATAGTISFKGREISNLSDHELSNYRREVVGFVFQFYNLIPNLTALENVGIAAQLANNADESIHFLKKVGLELRKNNFPSQLSGGEMQRVAIARALAKKPQLLLCDEPTGALDSQTGHKVIQLLKEIAEDSKVAVVLVTHNEELLQGADKVIRLLDGQVQEISEASTFHSADSSTNNKTSSTASTDSTSSAGSAKKARP